MFRNWHSRVPSSTTYVDTLSSSDGLGWPSRGDISALGEHNMSNFNLIALGILVLGGLSAISGSAHAILNTCSQDPACSAAANACTTAACNDLANCFRSTQCAASGNIMNACICGTALGADCLYAPDGPCFDTLRKYYRWDPATVYLFGDSSSDLSKAATLAAAELALPSSVPALPTPWFVGLTGALVAAGAGFVARRTRRVPG